MINVKNVFTELFSYIEPFQTEYGNQVSKPLFHLGDQSELDKVIMTADKNDVKPYPFIWYKLPNSLQENDHYIKGNFEFVIANLTEYHWLNDQRFDESFTKILYPISEKVINAFKQAGNVQLNYISDKNFWERTEYPNYGYRQGSKDQDKTEYWDALLLKVNLTINNNCIGTLKL